MPGGSYLVLASRRSFAPAQYGQKQWKGAAVPITMEENATAFLTIRLERFGAISGTVVDENDVGLQEHDVVAYRNTRPPTIAARGKTDDRGVYRIWGLEPGAYLIRTVGKQYDEGSYLPTFSRETARLDEARAVEVQLDQETTDVNVRPFPGVLYTLAGRAIVYAETQVTLTLVSDMGSETTVSDQQGNFRFNPTAPGPYELLARGQADRRYNNGEVSAAYQPIVLDRDDTAHPVVLARMPVVRLTAEDTKGQAIDASVIHVLYRRKDLSGEGKPETLRAAGRGGISLPPGRYDLALAPSAAYYAAGFSGPRGENTIRGRADGWNEVVLAGSGVRETQEVKFILSPRPATIRGVARNSGQDGVAGVPVFLEAYDMESRRRVADVRMIRADTRGQFEFHGLAPGHYRLIATFDFQMPDAVQMEAARVVKADEGQDQTIDLDLYVSR
jgi:protocatechuate 3,4-dioxygenase beta subunit